MTSTVSQPSPVPELVGLAASDAHDAARRGPGLEDAPPALARWMTEEVPRAMLAGVSLPPRPSHR